MARSREAVHAGKDARGVLKVAVGSGRRAIAYDWNVYTLAGQAKVIQSERLDVIHEDFGNWPA